jgi:acyl-coenzyme A thioesterase PaaI-like protein
MLRYAPMSEEVVSEEPFVQLPSHYRYCFGCGTDHPTGLHMKVRGRKDRVEGSFTVTEHHQGAPGLAHGGVIAAAVDEAMGFLIYLLAAPAVTVHLEVDYRKPVPVGSTLELVTIIDKVDGRKISSTLTGTIDGVVHVEARSIYLKVEPGHFKPYMERMGEKLDRPYNP